VFDRSICDYISLNYSRKEQFDWLVRIDQFENRAI
jgi:hypothetical protein